MKTLPQISLLFDLLDHLHNSLCLSRSVTDICPRRHCCQTINRILRNIQRLYKFSHAFLVHSFSSRQLFQLFVRFLHVVSSHNRLDRFRKNFPVAVQIRCHRCRVDIQLPQTSRRALVCQQRMTKTNAQVTQHGRIRQISLPPGNRQFRR